MAGRRQQLAEEGAMAIGRYTLQARYCNAQGKLDGLRRWQEPQDTDVRKERWRLLMNHPPRMRQWCARILENQGEV